MARFMRWESQLASKQADACGSRSFSLIRPHGAKQACAHPAREEELLLEEEEELLLLLELDEEEDEEPSSSSPRAASSSAAAAKSGRSARICTRMQCGVQSQQECVMLSRLHFPHPGQAARAAQSASCHPCGRNSCIMQYAPADEEEITQEVCSRIFTPRPLFFLLGA